MKKKVMNIRPQEVTVDGERSVRYKGSDGKFHDVAPDGGNTAQSYAVRNNPNAYEIVKTDQYTSTGNLINKAVSCDGTNTEIPARELLQKLIADPNLTVIHRCKPDGRTVVETALLRVVQFNNNYSEASLRGELWGNRRIIVQCFIYGNENRISIGTQIES